MRAIFLLTLAALLAAGEAGAQAHKPPPPWEDPAGPPVDMDVWLKRLVGGYRFEGMVQVVYTKPGAATSEYGCVDDNGNPRPYCQGVKGMGDCVAIGTGPGVQCILNVTWQDMYEMVTPSAEQQGGVFNLPAGVSFLDPSMLLFGLDPGKAAINHLLVDQKGLPEGGLGSNNGDRATFKTACVNAPILLNAMKPPARGDPQWRTCDTILRIDAKPDAKVLNMTIDIEINEEPFTRLLLSLYREAQVQVSAVPGLSPVLR